jgi:hypothetical protein
MPGRISDDPENEIKSPHFFLLIMTHYIKAQPPKTIDLSESGRFARGLQDWTIEPAEERSIQSKSMAGYSWLQDRYPRTSFGDHFISFKRSAKQPTIIRQMVKKLDLTRLNSLKLIATDLQHLDIKQKLSLSIQLDSVEIIKDRTFQFVYPSNYNHRLESYNRNHPAWFNFLQNRLSSEEEDR